MNIYEQLQVILKGREGDIVSSTELKRVAKKKFGTNTGSVLLYDYCYNRINNGTKFDKHIFEYLGRNSYRYLGEYYPFTGKIYHNPLHQKEREVGEWVRGTKIIYQHED